MLPFVALLSVARAAEFFLETAPVPDRQTAAETENAVEAAGYDARVVRRFKLGKGWEFVVFVEHFPNEADAAAAAKRLASVSPSITVFRSEDQHVVQVETAQPAAAKPADRPVPELLARIAAAHGGDTGGTRALARAAAVHFVYTRTLEVAGKTTTVRHDYWRQGPSRRLVVETNGAATDSIAVASASGAWLRVGSQVSSRDVGVLIGTVDAFAPEAVFTLALDVPSLLASPECAKFKMLEGAESGIRIGQGGDESETGLSFLDVDPATSRMIRARYVTEAGPVTFELGSWREVAPGILIPADVRIERADGRVETVRVERFDVTAGAPPGTFDRPG
jgi:hypothetical protein